jgi:broad specificity phosphatase PhoE
MSSAIGLLNESRVIFHLSLAHTSDGGGPAQGGGESTIDVLRRASVALEELAVAHPGQRVVVASHGGTIANLHLLATG